MTYDPNEVPGGGVLMIKFIALGVILTIGIVAGIKYFMNENSRPPQPAAAAQEIFKPEERTESPGYNPARRAESYSSGGALDLFVKTNEGYARDGEAADEEDEAPAEVKKATAAAPAPTAARSSAKVKTGTAGGTAIPKLKPVKGFGSDKGSSGGKNSMPKGIKMPDISGIINNATKDVPKQGKSSTE